MVFEAGSRWWLVWPDEGLRPTAFDLDVLQMVPKPYVVEVTHRQVKDLTTLGGWYKYHDIRVSFPQADSVGNWNVPAEMLVPWGPTVVMDFEEECDDAEEGVQA